MDFQSGPQNLNPTIYERTEERAAQESDYDNEIREEIDRREIFDLIRSINDPEHPLTLEGSKGILLFPDLTSPFPRTPCSRPGWSDDRQSSKHSSSTISSNHSTLFDVNKTISHSVRISFFVF